MALELNFVSARTNKRHHHLSLSLSLSLARLVVAPPLLRACTRRSACTRRWRTARDAACASIPEVCRRTARGSSSRS